MANGRSPSYGFVFLLEAEPSLVESSIPRLFALEQCVRLKPRRTFLAKGTYPLSALSTVHVFDYTITLGI